MNPTSQVPPDTPPDPYNEIPVAITTPAKLTLWQKLGGTSLTASVVFHAALLVIALFWIFKIVTPPEKKVDFMPRSGGGGSVSAEKRTQQRRLQMLQPDRPRTVAIGASSAFTLPEPDPLTSISSLGSLASGSISGGLGGTGSGGGSGAGTGLGFGAGSGLGRSDGSGTKNPFGGLSLDRNALVGTFYDLKQTRDGRPTGLSVEQAQKALVDFTTHGWRDITLNKYFQAPDSLYQSKLYIPSMSADEAPAAFNVADKVKPGRWAIVYRGTVTPPRSGKFRFVGGADDVLVVRFNGRNVFDHGWYSGTTDARISQNFKALMNPEKNEGLERIMRRHYPMPLPLQTFTYQTTKNINQQIGGMAVGPVFEAIAGREYPIDILLSELPGGLFCGSLLIQEQGVPYDKAPSGAPILPIFRFDKSVPAPTKADNAPPYDPNGPVWRVTSSRGRIDI